MLRSLPQFGPEGSSIVLGVKFYRFEALDVQLLRVCSGIQRGHTILVALAAAGVGTLGSSCNQSDNKKYALMAVAAFPAAADRSSDDQLQMGPKKLSPCDRDLT
jgi:hypothetical protein